MNVPKLSKARRTTRPSRFLLGENQSSSFSKRGYYCRRSAPTPRRMVGVRRRGAREGPPNDRKPVCAGCAGCAAVQGSSSQPTHRRMNITSKIQSENSGPKIHLAAQRPKEACMGQARPTWHAPFGRWSPLETGERALRCCRVGRDGHDALSTGAPRAHVPAHGLARSRL